MVFLKGGILTPSLFGVVIIFSGHNGIVRVKKNSNLPIIVSVFVFVSVSVVGLQGPNSAYHIWFSRFKGFADQLEKRAEFGFVVIEWEHSRSFKRFQLAFF